MKIEKVTMISNTGMEAYLRTMDCHPQSVDLKTIKLLWDHLDREQNKRQRTIPEDHFRN